MDPTPLDLLATARTVVLTTYRKDGTPVPTPVWVVRSGDELRVWTNPAAGKVKRIRNSGRVTLAPSSIRGRVRGAAVPGTASILPAAEANVVLAAIGRKYGLSGRLAQLTNWVRSRTSDQPSAAAIGITLD